MIPPWLTWEAARRVAPFIIGALIILGLFGVVAGYGHTKYKAGFTAAEAEYKPKLVACAADLGKATDANRAAEQAIKQLKLAYGDLELAVKQLEARERVARLRGEQIAAELARKEKVFLQEAARLQAIIEGPRALTPEEACKGAELILTEEARLRVGRISK